MVGIAVPNGESALPNRQPRYLARVSDPLTGEFWPPSVRNYTEQPARVYVLTHRLGPLFAVRNRVTPPQRRSLPVFSPRQPEMPGFFLRN